ncbi:MAG: S8 family serine peptidase [Halobacteriales archaeon]|nr:S8 family serine peptidase [Halobacteriales archaeon]
MDHHSFVQPALPGAVPNLPNPFDTLRPDPDGQGTGAASVVAGLTLGVAKDARLLDLQVSGKYTGTAVDPAAESAAFEAMDWLLAHVGGNGSANPRVALLSFASRDLSGTGAESLATQAEGLWKAGVLVVVPAGGTSRLHASPYVLTVAGSEGPCGKVDATPTAPSKPDLSAQAKDVTVAQTRTTPPGPAAGTVTVAGTPYAAARVAGAAALAWQARPDLSIAALAAILRDTAKDLGDAGPDGCGFGAVDPAAAVQAALAWTDPTPTAPLAKPTPVPFLAVVAAVGLAVARRRAQAR